MGKGICGGRWAAIGGSSVLCHTCYEWLTVTTQDKETLCQIEAVGPHIFLLSHTAASVAVGPLAMGAHEHASHALCCRGLDSDMPSH